MTTLLVTAGRLEPRHRHETKCVDIHLFSVTTDHPDSLRGRRFNKVIVTYDAGKEMYYGGEKGQYLRHLIHTFTNDPVKDVIHL
jgi:hypothetical protein